VTATGLRRFAVKSPAPGTPQTGAPQTSAPVTAAVDRENTTTVLEPERCEMCREPLDGRTGHGHVVELEKRSIVCACRACYLLFTHDGAASGRYRSVPSRVCYDPTTPLTDEDWSELQIPVAMAFFFFNSALDKIVAGYPSPGGTTECELDLEAWDRMVATYPLINALTPDVEALFVNRKDTGNEIFLIPIDECYSLVGELRLRWQGFDGGAEAHAAIAAFLTSLRRRAVELPLRRTAAPEERNG
jgi:hypothetical protein